MKTLTTTTSTTPNAGRRASLIICLLLLGVAQLGIAGDQIQPRVLPRVFQQVKLGMALNEVLRLKPDIAVTKRTNFATVSLIQTPSDRYVQRVVYRFHENTLYEIEIRYRPDRLQHGASGLLERLREEYGEPLTDRLEEVDFESNDLHRRRTLWQDERTKITLLEREYFRDGNSVTEITLTMTDLALQRRRDEAQEKQIHHKMQEVPIPHVKT